MQAEHLPRFDFAGEGAIVTGASRGIGPAIADALAAAGAEVAGVDVIEPEKGDDFRHRFRRLDIAMRLPRPACRRPRVCSSTRRAAPASVRWRR